MVSLERLAPSSPSAPSTPSKSIPPFDFAVSRAWLTASLGYDCMYMEVNNQFYTHSEGGYINLAYHYDANRCTFIKDHGDLYC